MNRDPRNRRMTEAEYRAYRRRQAAQAEQRRHELEMRQMMEKRAKKRRRQEARRVFFGRLMIFGITLAVLLLVSVGVFLIFFHHTPDAVPEKSVTYTYGGRTVRKADFETACDGGVYYLCAEDLADYLGLTETGTAENRRFLFAGPDETDTAGTGDEEYIRFPVGEASAVVNGQSVRLDGVNRLIGENVWVSTDVVSVILQNVSLQNDGRTIAVARIADTETETGADGKPLSDKITYLQASFRLKSVEPMETIPEGQANVPGGTTTIDPDTGEEVTDEIPSFATDLSNYEQYMNPENRDDYLILVNTKNTLTSAYEPDDLVDVSQTASGRATQRLRRIAAKALDALYIEMRAAGYTSVAVNSGFRTYGYQAMLFETYTGNEMSANPDLTRAEAEAIVLTYSTRPGTSEHQTGLAVDMDIGSAFTTDFQYTEEYQWLLNNAWKFGFILRFPDDKTDITTISFEPWHWRFVGRYHAKRIMDAGVCLEEYVADLNG